MTYRRRRPMKLDDIPPDPILDDVVSPYFGAPMYYDRDRRPITFRRYLELYESDFRKTVWVAQDWVHGVRVSTVWTGRDQGIGRSSVPVIFETMTFAERGNGDVAGKLDLRQWRYATEQGAREGHWRVRYWVRKELQRLNGPPPLKVKPKRRRRRR